LRVRAQQWLKDNGYAPNVVEIGSRWVMFAAGFVPWVHVDDHPDEDRLAMQFHISLPDSIEAFVHASRRRRRARPRPTRAAPSSTGCSSDSAG